MADCDYGDNVEAQRKKRFPYRGPAPHRNPAPGPMGLSGPWQDGASAPRPPSFNNRRGRGGFKRGYDPSRQPPPPFQNNNGQSPLKDYPKNKKTSPYNMTVNPSGKVDVAAAKQKRIVFLQILLNNFSKIYN